MYVRFNVQGLLSWYLFYIIVLLPILKATLTLVRNRECSFLDIKRKTSNRK